MAIPPPTAPRPATANWYWRSRAAITCAGVASGFFLWTFAMWAVTRGCWARSARSTTLRSTRPWIPAGAGGADSAAGRPASTRSEEDRKRLTTACPYPNRRPPTYRHDVQDENQHDRPGGDGDQQLSSPPGDDPAEHGPSAGGGAAAMRPMPAGRRARTEP